MLQNKKIELYELCEYFENYENFDNYEFIEYCENSKSFLFTINKNFNIHNFVNKIYFDTNIQFFVNYELYPENDFNEFFQLFDNYENLKKFNN